MNILGSELLVFGCLCAVVVLVLFCLCFCFTVWFCSPASCLNISFFSASCFAEHFRERTLGIWHLWSFYVFWCCFCLCFCFIMWCCSPESCLKNSPSLRSVVFCSENFRERTLRIWDLCSFDVFWCCFCVCFCFITWCCSPESCLKKFS